MDDASKKASVHQTLLPATPFDFPRITQSDIHTPSPEVCRSLAIESAPSEVQSTCALRYDNFIVLLAAFAAVAQCT